jgi:hypothetical protein
LGKIKYSFGEVLAFDEVDLAFVLAITLVVPINNSAFGKESSPESNTTSQCELLQQALMIELHPEIMSVLRKQKL